MLEIAINSLTALVAVGIPAWYIVKNSRQRKRASEKLAQAEERGLTEPVSLHPKIDLANCIQTGACVPSCPEGEILGIIDGRAAMVSPTKCIGHGACEAACPVEAIALVFGTERRGVELPFVKPTFETNVSGVYIAGELGGMGLIRNAVTQGREAIEFISESLTQKDSAVKDVIVVGAGPAGLAASLQAKKQGLNVVTVDQDDIGGTVLSYPRQKLVMTQPMEIPLYGRVKFREIIKEDLLELWHQVIDKTGLEVKTHEKVEEIERVNGHFKINTSKGEHLAQRVLLAIGRRGTPRKLGVPGEKTSKVAYRLLEPEQYRRKKVVVIGGGDSAIEAALALSEQKGTEVILSYRKGAFSRIKEKNEERIEQAIQLGKVRVAFESQVKEIKREHVVLSQNNKDAKVHNDYVFIMIGGVLPTQFLQNIGISIEKKFGER